MPTHPLIACATRRPYREVPDMPDGAFYDRASGYWMYKGKPLVEDDQFAGQRVTKKCDQETGEDQKGE